MKMNNSIPQPPVAPTPPQPTRGQKIRQMLSNTGVQIPLSVFLALATGILINELIGPDRIPNPVKLAVAFPGDLWLVALKSIVVPLILTSIVQSMQGLKKMPGGGNKIAKIGIGYFIISTIVAMLIAIAFCYLLLVPNLKPIDLDKLSSMVEDATNDVKDAPKNVSLFKRFLDMFRNLLPENPVNVMAQGDLLAVLSMGIVIGLLIIDTEENPSIIMKFLRELEYLVTVIVTFLVNLSPVGIFSLILSQMMVIKISEMMAFLGWFLATLFISLAVHYFIFYPLVYFIFIRQNGFKFLFAMTPGALTAMGVSSSAAAMPSMLKCCHDVGIHPDIYKFLIPLGVTINADGAAIAFICSLFFMTYGIGMTLGPIDCLILMLTDFLACMGAPPIPAAGLLFMVMMLNAVNVPTTPIFSLVAAFDWLTDRPATALNVVGDAFGCALAQKYGMGLDIDPEINKQYDMEHQPNSATAEKVSKDKSN